MKNLKFFQTFLAMFLLVAIFFVSCSKEEVAVTETLAPINQVEESVEASTRLEDMPTVEVYENALRFTGGTDFFDQEAIIAKADDVVLDAWEAEMGFTSLRTLINEAYDAYEDVNTEEETAAFLEQYKDLVKIRDGSLVPVVNNHILASIVNADGIYRVDAAVMKVIGEKMIEVRDGDMNKLAMAERSMESNETENVFVFDHIGVAEQRTCPSMNTAFAPLNSSTDRRVNLEIFRHISACGCGYYRGLVVVHVWGEKKNVWGNYKRYDTALDYSNVGFEITSAQGTFIQDNKSGSTTTDSEDLYGFLYYGSLGTAAQVIGSFDKVKGRASSRGVGNVYAVICCGGYNPCPSASN